MKKIKLITNEFDFKTCIICQTELLALEPESLGYVCTHCNKQYLLKSAKVETSNSSNNYTPDSEYIVYVCDIRKETKDDGIIDPATISAAGLIDSVTLLATSTAGAINTVASTVLTACQFVIKLIQEHCLTCDFYYRNRCAMNAYSFCFNAPEPKKTVKETTWTPTPLAQRFYDTPDLWGIIRAHLRKKVEYAKDLEKELKGHPDFSSEISFKIELSSFKRFFKMSSDTNWDEVLSSRANTLKQDIVLEYATPERQVISKKYICTIDSINSETGTIRVSAIESEEPAVVKGTLMSNPDEMPYIGIPEGNEVELESQNYCEYVCENCDHKLCKEGGED